jgi:hypothetical protein
MMKKYLLMIFLVALIGCSCGGNSTKNSSAKDVEPQNPLINVLKKKVDSLNQMTSELYGTWLFSYMYPVSMNKYINLSLKEIEDEWLLTDTVDTKCLSTITDHADLSIKLVHTIDKLAKRSTPETDDDEAMMAKLERLFIRDLPYTGEQKEILLSREVPFVGLKVKDFLKYYVNQSIKFNKEWYMYCPYNGQELYLQVSNGKIAYITKENVVLDKNGNKYLMSKDYDNLFINHWFEWFKEQASSSSSSLY